MWRSLRQTGAYPNRLVDPLRGRFRVPPSAQLQLQLGILRRHHRWSFEPDDVRLVQIAIAALSEYETPIAMIICHHTLDAAKSSSIDAPLPTRIMVLAAGGGHDIDVTGGREYGCTASVADSDGMQNGLREIRAYRALML
jgi:hypothetical protein